MLSVRNTYQRDQGKCRFLGAKVHVNLVEACSAQRLLNILMLGLHVSKSCFKPGASASCKNVQHNVPRILRKPDSDKAQSLELDISELCCTVGYKKW